MARIRTGKERRDIIIVTAITILLPLFSMYISLSERLFDFSTEHELLGITEYLINFCFLYLSGLLYLTYHRWLKAEKKGKELENIIASINPDVLIVVDQHRKIIVCNDTIKRMFGYNVDEAIQQTTDLLYFDRRSYPEDNKHEIYEALEREGFHVGLATGKKKNGETFPLEIITGNLSEEQGAVLLLRDITIRKEAEEALQESERGYRELSLKLQAAYLWMSQKKDQIEARKYSESIIFLTADDGRICGFTERAVGITKKSHSDIQGCNIQDILVSQEGHAFRDLINKVKPTMSHLTTLRLKNQLEDGPVYEAKLTCMIVEGKKLFYIGLY